jgi:hypothetical protein
MNCIMIPMRMIVGSYQTHPMIAPQGNMNVTACMATPNLECKNFRICN